MKQIIFGSSKKKDLNLCSPITYAYNIIGGDLPNLEGNTVTFKA
jgi:hypothetical protein